MLFYLGPELIATLLGAYEGLARIRKRVCGLSQPRADERDVTRSLISSSSLPCPPTSTVAVSVTIRLFLDQVRIHETDALS